MSIIKNERPIPADAWHVGDACFYYEPWSEAVVEARIAGLPSENDPSMLALRNVSVPGQAQRLYDDLFPDRKSAQDAVARHKASRYERYASEITDLESAIAFAWSHTVSLAEEYTDWEARRAFGDRVRALTGVALPD